MVSKLGAGHQLQGGYKMGGGASEVSPLQKVFTIQEVCVLGGGHKRFPPFESGA